MSEISSALVDILEATNFSFTNSFETFQWMSTIDGLEDFYNWLINIITEENLVTHDEIICYKHIIESDKVLDDEELETKINNYICNEPNVHLEEISIYGLEQAIEYKKKVLNDLSTINNRISSEVLQHESKIFVSSAESLLSNEVKKVENVNEEYIKQFAALEMKFEKLCENISSLNEKGQEPIYFCQQNLKNIVNTDSNLKVKIKMIKNIIYKEYTMDLELSSQNVAADDMMNLVFDWISQQEYNIADYKAKIFAANKVLEYLDDLENNIENANCIFDNRLIPTKQISKPSKNQLMESCELILKDTIRGIQINICEERLKKRKIKLTFLDSFEKIVKTRRLCNESLYFLLMNEWKNLRASVSLLKDIHSCWELTLSEFKKRMAWMKRLTVTEQMPSSLTNTSSKQLTGKLSISFNSSLQSVNNSSMFALRNFLAKHKMRLSLDFENFCSTVREIVCGVKKIDHFLFYKKPTCSQNIAEYFIKIYGLSRNMSVKDVIQQYEEYKATMDNEEKDLLHMMWYEWNKNPFAVIQTVLKMEEAARIKKKRLSILFQKELSTAQYKEYSKF